MSPMGYITARSSSLIKIQFYKGSAGHSPFLDWLNGLSDQQTRVRIKVRLDRLERGHFGDCRPVGDGVHELRMHFGPGYRIYFGALASSLVVILVGGIKRTQK